jgi:hypothetical protein
MSHEDVDEKRSTDERSLDLQRKQRMESMVIKRAANFAYLKVSFADH